MNQTAASALALACVAKLSTEIIMRLSNNGISGTIDGTYITRTTVASATLHTVVGALTK